MQPDPPQIVTAIESVRGSNDASRLPKTCRGLHAMVMASSSEGGRDIYSVRVRDARIRVMHAKQQYYSTKHVAVELHTIAIITRFCGRVLKCCLR